MFFLYVLIGVKCEMFMCDPITHGDKKKDQLIYKNGTLTKDLSVLRCQNDL